MKSFGKLLHLRFVKTSRFYNMESFGVTEIQIRGEM